MSPRSFTSKPGTWQEHGAWPPERDPDLALPLAVVDKSSFLHWLGFLAYKMRGSTFMSSKDFSDSKNVRVHDSSHVIPLLQTPSGSPHCPRTRTILAGRAGCAHFGQFPTQLRPFPSRQFDRSTSSSSLKLLLQGLFHPQAPPLPLQDAAQILTLSCISPRPQGALAFLVGLHR